MIDSITGVVLAGGKSTRMGRNKALLVVGGKSLIEYPLDALSKVFSRIVLSIKEPENYSDLSYPLIADLYRDSGPLSGIASVLDSGEESIFCVGCDMPFLNIRLIERLCGFSGYDAVIPVWKNRPEVLHAFYAKSVLPKLRSAILKGRLKITDALWNANVKFVPEEQIRQLDPDGKSFSNINTPEEYDRLL